MAAWLDRLGRGAARHKWRTILIWLLAVVALAAGAVAASGHTQDIFGIPGAPAQRASDLLAQRFPTQSGDTALVVFAAPHGTLTTPAATAAITATQQRLAQLPD